VGWSGEEEERGRVKNEVATIIGGEAERGLTVSESESAERERWCRGRKRQ
jgi:hypothetical protein